MGTRRRRGETAIRKQEMRDALFLPAVPGKVGVFIFSSFYLLRTCFGQALWRPWLGIETRLSAPGGT